jgi:hypothetical protein
LQISFNQIPESCEFFVGCALLIDGRLVVVGGDVSCVAIRTIFGVGASSQSEVSPSVDHIHRERMIVTQQKLKLLSILAETFSLIFFSPMCQPSTVDLPTEQHSFRLEFPRVVVLLLCNAGINPDVGSVPVVFLDVEDCVYVILIGLDADVPP